MSGFRGILVTLGQTYRCLGFLVLTPQSFTALSRGKHLVIDRLGGYIYST